MNGLFSALMFHILITVCSSSSISFLMSFKFAEAWICLRTIYGTIFVYMEFRVLAFELFHNVYVCDGALWLDLSLFIYDFYFVFESDDFL